MLQFPDAATAARAAERLRARAAANDSRVALVLDALAERRAASRPGAARADRGDEGELASLRIEAAHVVRRLRQAGGDSRLVAALSEAESPPAWLRLSAGELLVVPRLGSVAMPQEFVREIERVAPDATWIERPYLFD